MRNLSYILLVFALATIFVACKSDEKTSVKKANLPQSRGESSEIVLVMDSAQWAGELGLKIREIFHAEIVGLPQPERMFTLRRVSPHKVNDFLRMASTMIFVFTLDSKSSESRALRNYFTENSLKSIQENENIFSLTKQDVYARNQEVMYLFGQTEEYLIAKLEKNKANVQKHFNEIESKRLKAKFTKNVEKGLMNSLSRQHGLRMNIPLGYELAHQKDNFLWYRQLDQEREKNIWITWMDYESEEQFKEKNILPLRDSLAKKHIFDIEDPSLHLASQNQEPFYFEYLDLNGNYSVEIRGLWKYSDFSRGGGFVGYLILDEDNNRLYYAEGYLDAPGKSKRDGIKELEAILKSLQLEKNKES